MRQPSVKLPIVTDDDIDINNPDDLDWAVTFCIQADRDLVVVQAALGKHIDPSIKSWELGKGGFADHRRTRYRCDDPRRRSKEAISAITSVRLKCE